jgi:Flp pilus assembly protein TadG
MSARSSDRGILERVRNERGAVLVMVAIGMVALCGVAGLALDSARGYVTRSELSRGVDAAALAGARGLRKGEAEAESRALALAEANGVTGAVVEFGVNADGENTVTVTASRTVPTWFMRVLGNSSMEVASTATAAAPPLDVVLVLDQSGSLATEGAWDDLQDAAKNFVDEFSESLDQMGLVSFQIRGTQRYWLDKPFRSSIQGAINAMSSAGDTNTGEGLRMARLQMESGAVREEAVRVVVFFTDGRPTAFRGTISGQDRMMAVYTTVASGRMRGYFNNPDGLPTDSPATASGCVNATSCLGWTEPTIRNKSRQNGLVEANNIREEGIYVFSIGLGNPDAPDPILVPDMDYLRQIANEDGVVDGGQPQGKAYFAPTPEELDEVFRSVAEDIVVRLTQ